MTIAVTGSIATDHLMTFPGRFSDSLVGDQLERLTLSFLVEDLEVRRGGCAANIAFGLGCLGLRPVLVGAVGEDFAEYRSWLERHGVDCDDVHVSESRHTARFICTNDKELAQIASFYAGAMSEARLIELKPVADRHDGLDLGVISPIDPESMLRHTDECRMRAIDFVADPSQQLHFGDGPMIRRLVEGAAFLVSNDYEAALLQQKTGWTVADVLDRVGSWVLTRGAKGVSILEKDHEPLEIPAVPGVVPVEPTGVGDAFRSGYLAGLAWGLDVRRSAEVGCTLAAFVIETVGTQEYELSRQAFLDRFRSAYGDAAAAEVAPHVRCPRP